MKKILFAFAIMPLLIMACSSDDEDKTPVIDFDHNIEMLYGEWRATSVELGDQVIDLTDETWEELVEPTYVTFKKDGVYSTKGILGEGTGVFTTKDKTIATIVDENKVNFEMTALSAETAKIELDPKDFDLGIPMQDDEDEEEEIGTVVDIDKTSERVSITYI